MSLGIELTEKYLADLPELVNALKQDESKMGNLKYICLSSYKHPRKEEYLLLLSPDRDYANVDGEKVLVSSSDNVFHTYDTKEELNNVFDYLTDGLQKFVNVRILYKIDV